MAAYCLDDPIKIFETRMCLNALSKNGEGRFSHADTDIQPCDKPPCKTLKTIQTLEMKVEGWDCDSELGKYFDGKFIVERFVGAYEDGDGNNRGIHSGDFKWVGTDVVAEGRIAGVTNAGTHREPIFDPCQPCDAHGYMEGRFCGVVVETKVSELKGCHLLGTYRFRFDPTSSGPDGGMAGTFEGELLCPCHG